MAYLLNDDLNYSCQKMSSFDSWFVGPNYHVENKQAAWNKQGGRERDENILLKDVDKRLHIPGKAAL